MGILDLGRYKGIVFAITGFLVFIAIILAVNHGKAGQFSDNVAGVRFLENRAKQPGAVYDISVQLAERLRQGEKIDETLSSLQKAAAAFDNSLNSLANGGMITDASGDVFVLPTMTTPAAVERLKNASKLWDGYKAKLNPVINFSGSPYYTAQPAPAPAAANGKAPAAAPAAPAEPTVQYSPRGRRLQAALNDLVQYGNTAHGQLAKVMTDLSVEVEAASRTETGTLRAIQVGGMVAALLLLGAIFLFFARNLRKEEAASNRQRKETQDILRTVNEGLFLLDKDLKLGSERSMALNGIFRREDFSDLTFDKLLKDIVPEKTLKTAMDYVALLWGERVNEKLVKTINPLNEVEVHFDNPAGGFDTHFLEFDFNRVKSEGSLSHLLVTVNDVTKRVMLSRELQDSQEKAQAQLDLLLRILHVEPDSLTSFLTDADVSLKMVNSILKEPAREETAFRAKIDGIYRQVHAVKGEAAALGLKTVEQRAHAFEESLNDLKGRPSLSGSDFLPLVVKLDDLFNHLAQVREMLSRLVDLHHAIASKRSAGGEVAAEKVDQWLAGQEQTQITKALVAPPADVAEATGAIGGLERTLEDLAARVASSQSKRVNLRCTGLDAVPEAYRRAVKDITIQLVRNAVVHGIEEPSERAKANKAETGALAVEFSPRGADGYELIVQDDGRGLQLDRIKEVAVERGLITPAQAALLDPRQTMALIFRPGFSTADRVTTDAGRGAGMDLVRILVAELGGRVGLASAGGKFSKFKIWLPTAQSAAAA
ncbi:Hpt domain-containing protein [Steroidobacter sp. S1-65]|uniref:histidine kinase n=1 Tax=Steroidobacter gossypii TaxID=2805490 RepID=A0ABS1WSJ2_9GAMM|nr:ATP-binding protein [Steroidobacter gossypii]MBM0103948.1 Hpt domain-containing protein [Steroidobacter gossypii]